MADIENKIISVAKKHNLFNYDELRPATKKHLIEIESYIEKTNEKRVNAIKEYNTTSLNIKNITDNTTVSKATIYNNASVLKAYVDTRINECESNDPFVKNKNREEYLDKRCDDLEKLLDETLSKIIDIENLKADNASLLNDIKNKDDVIIDLSASINQLQSEINSYKKRLYKYENKITHINK